MITGSQKVLLLLLGKRVGIYRIGLVAASIINMEK